MNDNSDQSVQEELNKLLREVNEPDQSTDHSEQASRATQRVSSFASMFFQLSLFGMMCLGLGFWVGQSTAKIAQ